MAKMTLVIGNKTYSSWSLRPWLALRQTGEDFEVVVIPLRQSDTKSAILAHSGAGKVPVLHHGATTIWESLAICEYLADRFPDAALWPKDLERRAIGRAAATEMHGGFADLRRALPMDLKRAPEPRSLSFEVLADVTRITALWTDLRSRFGDGGPFLLGAFSIVDAMYAPICLRFDTYRVPLDPVCRSYVDAVSAWPAMVEWRTAALAEPWQIDFGV